MCGRFAFFQSPSEARRQLRELGDPVDEIWGDESVRQSYNFAPGYTGLVCRAIATDAANGSHNENDQGSTAVGAATGSDDERRSSSQHPGRKHLVGSNDPKYVLQAMKWGLIPFWTKQKPQYGSLMRTINCRNDSLLGDRGMWTSMKRRKRCIVLCNGFYEWLKKNDGKERLPHYIKRKDNELMCLAGLWDCVRYEDEKEDLYTFTIITTDSNKQLRFLHDRMPMMLEHNSNAMRTWLDPSTVEWNTHLQSLLKPFDGDLDIYPVRKEVGKVGNDSPDFIVPLHSIHNKSNIANFFTSPKKEKAIRDKEQMGSGDGDLKKKHATDLRETIATHSTEHNAPIPISHQEPIRSHELKVGVKRELDYDDKKEKIIKSPRKHDNLKANSDDKGEVDKSPASKLSKEARSPKKSIHTRQSSDKSFRNERITSFFNTF